jgi:hypothetical protein
MIDRDVPSRPSEEDLEKTMILVGCKPSGLPRLAAVVLFYSQALTYLDVLPDPLNFCKNVKPQASSKGCPRACYPNATEYISIDLSSICLTRLYHVILLKSGATTIC